MGPSIVSNNLATCSLPWRRSCDMSSPAGLALASGLAATLTITHMLKSGDGIVCMDDVYGGERKAVQMMSPVQKCFLVRKRKNFVRALCMCVCVCFTHKAQTATTKELPVIWAWRCHLLTVLNQSCSRLP